MIPLELWGPSLPTAEEAQAAGMPRKVSVERHMRQYAHLNVRDMLDDLPSELLGTPSAPPAPPGHEPQGLHDVNTFLPLHLFDDEEYDCRYAFAHPTPQHAGASKPG